MKCEEEDYSYDSNEVSVCVGNGRMFAKIVPGLAFPEALYRCSVSAYNSFRATVEHHAHRKRLPRWISFEDPKKFVAGQHSFPWSTFFFGLKKSSRGGKRDRSFWHARGLLLPFDQLRRDLVREYGWMLVMDPSNGRVALCLNDTELDETFGKENQFWVEYEGRTYDPVFQALHPNRQTTDVLVVGERPEVAAHTFNIVPYIVA